MREEEVKALMESALSGEPTARTTVDEVVTAGRRRRTRRRLTLAGTGLSVATAAAVGALMVASSSPGTATAPTGNPLAAPLVPAGADGGDSAQGFRPDSLGGTEHTTSWTSKQLGDTLVSLLPAGKATVADGDFPGRTYRVSWDPGKGRVEIVGGAARTADSPQVPLCAKIMTPRHETRPGAPDPESASPLRSCDIVDLGGGAKGEAMTLRSPDGRTVSHYVRVLRADGRTVTLQMWNGQGTGDKRTSPYDNPPLDTAKLVAIANDPAWRF